MPVERSVKSAGRALAVLDLFEKLRRPARAGEIAKLLEYPQSSTSFLLNEMRKLGYLNHDAATRQFAPTMRVALLGGWIQAGPVGRSTLFDLVHRVHEKTKITSLLCTQNGQEVQYIHVAARFASPKLALRPGTLRPICRSAPGLVLLSECDDAEIGKLVRSINAQSPYSEKVQADAVMRKVQQTRANGYAWITGGVFKGIGSVAVRLPFDDILKKPLVLSIAGSASLIKRSHQDLARILQESIAEFSSAQSSKDI
ncbi:helix-turn-helix domain-containing protein [Bradyrhizobium sp. LHD-71]|uniref:IclR family transcriptional regulator n=1 Tax=Bradyrhizobium sp. LHD-71 TaxID=3072141 RepID=UPI00280CA91E|nr:helix-turn-helix domain-containing protein [Bradyrhizobium sp. LHD-71]MDQ8729822.1 helix-turn-helix domain-containing protein [Bradyrhizobium sp. LHD-71]